MILVGLLRRRVRVETRDSREGERSYGSTLGPIYYPCWASIMWAACARSAVLFVDEGVALHTALSAYASRRPPNALGRLAAFKTMRMHLAPLYVSKLWAEEIGRASCRERVSSPV